MKYFLAQHSPDMILEISFIINKKSNIQNMTKSDGSDLVIGVSWQDNWFQETLKQNIVVPNNANLHDNCLVVKQLNILKFSLIRVLTVRSMRQIWIHFLTI